MTARDDSPLQPVHSGAASAAASLLNGILSGDLRPGSRLHIKELVRRFGLGATPLREGLNRLLKSGLVVSIEQRGFRVARISPRSIDEYTALRILIEQEALRLAILEGDAIWASRARDAGVELSDFCAGSRERPRDAIMRLSAIHKAFHASLVEACPLTALKDHLDLLYDQEIFMCHNLADPHAVIADLRELHDANGHAVLLDAVLRRDGPNACFGLSRHLHEMAEMLRRRLAAQRH